MKTQGLKKFAAVLSVILFASALPALGQQLVPTPGIPTTGFHGLDDYRARSRRVFDAVDPFSRRNLDAYAARLLHLCRDAKFEGHAVSRT